MEYPHCDLWVDTVGVCSNRNQTAQMSTAHVPFQIYDFVQLCTCTQLVCVCVITCAVLSQISGIA